MSPHPHQPRQCSKSPAAPPASPPGSLQWSHASCRQVLSLLSIMSIAILQWTQTQKEVILMIISVYQHQRLHIMKFITLIWPFLWYMTRPQRHSNHIFEMIINFQSTASDLSISNQQLQIYQNHQNHQIDLINSYTAKLATPRFVRTANMVHTNYGT